MCGRFVTNFSTEELVEYLSTTTDRSVVVEDEFFEVQRFNAAPTQVMPVALTAENAIRLASLRWGLVPTWSKDPAVGAKMINARAETVHEKPSFRGLLRGHRCAVPMRGFYEWLRPTVGAKAPYYVSRVDGRPMFVAGLWTTSPVLDGIRTFCTLTTESTGDLASIHHRSPVILEPNEVEEWLFGSDPVGIARSPRHSELRLIPVSTRVNSVRNDDPNLLDRIADEPRQTDEANRQGRLFD